MSNKVGALLLAVAVVLLSFAVHQRAYSQANEDTYTFEQGIVYAPGGVDPLTLNVAIPRGDGPFPCILYIGWAGVASYNSIAAIRATEKGYVGIVVDYRRIAAYPIPIADIKSALSWIGSNAAKLKIDRQRIALVGFEFGGYLTLMAAYTTQLEIGSLVNTGVSEYCVRAVVALAAPTDWRTMHPNAYDPLKGTTRSEVFFAISSPLVYIDPKDPPTLILHGEIDKDVPPVNAIVLDKKLTEKGVSHEYILLQDQPNQIMEHWQSQVVWDFLAKYLR